MPAADLQTAQFQIDLQRKIIDAYKLELLYVLDRLDVQCIDHDARRKERHSGGDHSERMKCDLCMLRERIKEALMTGLNVSPLPKRIHDQLKIYVPGPPDPPHGQIEVSLCRNSTREGEGMISNKEKSRTIQEYMNAVVDAKKRIAELEAERDRLKQQSKNLFEACRNRNKQLQACDEALEKAAKTLRDVLHYRTVDGRLAFGFVPDLTIVQTLRAIEAAKGEANDAEKRTR